MADYVVKSGDTLSAIGRRLGVDYHTISGYRSGNPNLIYPGEVLHYGSSTAPAPSAPVAPPKSAYEIAQEAWQKNYDEFKSAATNYDAANPFAFDEKLAESASHQQFDPYYNQQLSDFLTGVERQRQRSTQDEQNVLTELKADSDSYTGRVKLQLDRAINSSREGAADAGLLDSGGNLRNQGNLQVDTNQNLSDYLRNEQTKESQAKLQNTRSLEDLSTQQGIGQRNIEQQRQYDVQQGVNQSKNDAENQSLFARRQALEPYLTKLGTDVGTYEDTSYKMLYGG